MRLERELDEEVRFHLAMQLEDNLKSGKNSGGGAIRGATEL
jgi:hypothetical protein